MQLQDSQFLALLPFSTVDSYWQPFLSFPTAQDPVSHTCILITHGFIHRPTTIENRKDNLWQAFLHRKCKAVSIPYGGSGDERGRLDSYCSHLQMKIKKYTQCCKTKHRGVCDGALPQFTVTIKAAVTVHGKLKRAAVPCFTAHPSHLPQPAEIPLQPQPVMVWDFSGMATGSSESSTAEPSSEKK